MKRLSAIATITILLSVTLVSIAAPQDDAIAKYREYVAAVRAGNAPDVTKLIEPVPQSCQRLLDNRVKQAIALEGMKKELVAQMGPARTGDDAWSIDGLPYDDMLKSLKGVVQDENTVAILSTAPEGMVAWMVRRNDKWIVPAAFVLDLPPTPQFVEPDPEQQQLMIKYSESITKASEVVLKRLKAKEFTKPAEVLAAFSIEMEKAARP